MRKKVFLLLFCFFSVFLFCAEIKAGRSIATRYLNLAVNALSSEDYENADFLAGTGLSYDETIADFWFIRAKAASGKNAAMKEIISYLEKAVALTDWLKFSRTNSVVMLADLYYKTGAYEPCLDLLLTVSDSTLPELYYLEASACYELGKLQLARSVISLATSLYPDNPEFLSLFFKKEFEICEEAGAAFPYKESPRGELSRALQKRVKSHFEKNPELLLYSSFFVEAEEAYDLLQLYEAGTDVYGFHIFYPYAALKCGYLSEQDALDSYIKIAEGVFDYRMLCRIASEMKTEESRLLFQSFLHDFSCEIRFTSKEKSLYDLSCLYSYGRPQRITYDRNEDGFIEWYADCDYGAPVTLINDEHRFSLRYHSFPSVGSVSFSDSGTSYSFVPYSQTWTPVLLQKAPFGDEDEPFFIPVLQETDSELIEKDILSNANQVTLPLRDGITASFLLYDEIPFKGLYYENGVEIAVASFTDGVLTSRSVDMDRDGIKEIVELYKIPSDPGLSAGRGELVDSLFGKLPYKYDLWLSELLIDTDGDAISDYRSVYSEDGWTHNFWGIDAAGGYEASYSENADKSLKEAQFYHPIDNVLVTVVLRDDRLLSVTVGKVIYSVFYDAENDFYWVYEKPRENSFVPAVKELLDEKTGELNTNLIYQIDDNTRVLACKTCGVSFGVLLYD
ncbi:MAG: CDC27 family protein [Treponemataceae bacterium]|nr:CDC27 family protein [Treponemataceae bacterium]